MPSYEVLQQMRSAPLDVKVMMTQKRIMDAVIEFGERGLYVSVSGKDSRVVAHIIRNMGLHIEEVFCNTGLEYPEVQAFNKKMGATIIAPKTGFIQTIRTYGYPVISKEVSESIYGARKWLIGGGYEQSARKILGVGEYGSRGGGFTRPLNRLVEIETFGRRCNPSIYTEQIQNAIYAAVKGEGDNRVRKVLGIREFSNTDEGRKIYIDRGFP